jgi:hypothetical protein
MCPACAALRAPLAIDGLDGQPRARRALDHAGIRSAALVALNSLAKTGALVALQGPAQFAALT